MSSRVKHSLITARGRDRAGELGTAHPSAQESFQGDERAFGVGGAAFLAQSSLGSLWAVMGCQTGSGVPILTWSLPAAGDGAGICSTVTHRCCN